MAMEMTAVCLGKLAKTASFPHSHSLGDDLEFLFSPSSFNFNSTKSVTHMPGTFCYRHARSLRREKSGALAPATLSIGISCRFYGGSG